MHIPLRSRYQALQKQKPKLRWAVSSFFCPPAKTRVSYFPHPLAVCARMQPFTTQVTFPSACTTKNMRRCPHLFDPNTLGSVCPDCRRTGAYRPHTPLLLLLETEEHAQCSSKSCSRQRHSVSHTCCICVHRSRSPAGKLHQSDNLLQPAVKAALITQHLSVSSPGSGGPHAASCPSQNLSHACSRHSSSGHLHRSCC